MTCVLSIIIERSGEENTLQSTRGKTTSWTSDDRKGKGSVVSPGAAAAEAQGKGSVVSPGSSGKHKGQAASHRGRFGGGRRRLSRERTDERAADRSHEPLNTNQHLKTPLLIHLSQCFAFRVVLIEWPDHCLPWHQRDDQPYPLHQHAISLAGPTMLLQSTNIPWRAMVQPGQTANTMVWVQRRHAVDNNHVWQKKTSFREGRAAVGAGVGRCPASYFAACLERNAAAAGGRAGRRQVGISREAGDAPLGS